MKLTALRLRDVRRFAEGGIAIEEIGDGVNVLCAANEHGKSTCFDALHALFFQQHTSASAAVQGLRPYSGGHPLVEADIVTADGRYRLAKQFLGGRRASVTDLASGRLIAQAGEAEAFIGHLVRGGAAGPTGLLWVRQGQTGLDRRRGDDDGEKRAREGILSSVRGEVEAITGGRRMAEIARLCRDELGRLLTPTGRPKAGGPYAMALDERTRCTAEEQRLLADVTALREALERRRVARRQLAEIGRAEEEAELAEAVTRAEAELAAAASKSEALKAAEAEARLLDERQRAATAQHDTYRDALARIRDLAERYAATSRRRDDIQSRRRDAAERSEAARAAAMAAEREEAATRELSSRLDTALRARHDAERRTGLAERLSAAQAARDEEERLNALLRALVLAPGDVPRLERLDSDIAGLRAAAAARATSLRIEYAPGAQGRVSVAGVPLAAGEERPLLASASVEIAGIGTLRIRLSDGGAELQALQKAQAERAALLDRMGVANLPAALQREAAARERRTDLEIVRQRLALLAPKGIPVLQEELARLAPGEPDTEIADIAPDIARAAHARAEERMRDARAASREAEPARGKAEDELVEAEKALAALASQLETLDLQLGPEGEREIRLATLADESAATLAAAGKARAMTEALRAGGTDLPRLEDKLRRARSALDGTRVRAARLREELADLSGQIRTRAEEAVEEAWAEAVEAREAADAHVAEFEREVAILTRLRDALDEARVSAREHYFQPVMRELGPLLGLVFDDASVTFDPDTLLPRSVRRNGLEEEVGALSGGAKEQLAVLTRLAFARLLAREGHPAPVILDDALVYSDDDRIERMFEVLHRQSRDQQIIVFSCRQRAFARLGGTVLRTVPWEPVHAKY